MSIEIVLPDGNLILFGSRDCYTKYLEHLADKIIKASAALRMAAHRNDQPLVDSIVIAMERNVRRTFDLSQGLWLAEELPLTDTLEQT